MIPRSKEEREEKNGARWRDKPLQVGLRILIEAPSLQESANMVAKSPCVRLPSPSASSFLSACRLCDKQLGPLDAIYMYRGDEAFCSVECRCRKMMQDERRELEAAVRARLPTPPRLRSGRRRRESDRPRPILAVS